MSIRSMWIVFSCSLSLSPAFSSAQTNPLVSNLMNPAISINVLLLAEKALDFGRPSGLSLQETEIQAFSAVDPNWNLNAIFLLAEDEVAVEEAFVTTTSIESVLLKLGKMKASFGRHGLLHAHAFPFVQAPLALVNCLGAEGFNGSGAEAAWLTPLPWFCEWTGGIYRAGADDESPLNFGSPERDNLPWLAHLKNVFDLSDDVTMELGVSSLMGGGVVSTDPTDPDFNIPDGLVHAVLGLDLTLKSVPARQSNRAGWILQGEFLKKISHGREALSRTYVNDQEADGWYASFQYRLSQRWWVGLRAEEAFNSSATELVDTTGGPQGHIQRGSLNVSWAPSEFSAVRAEYIQEKANFLDGTTSTDNRIMLQFNYTIGAHPAHAY